MSAVVIVGRFALRGSGQDGARGNLTWLEQVAPTPTNIWEPIAKRQATQISTETMGATRLQQHQDWVFYKKIAAVKVKATLEEEVLFGKLQVTAFDVLLVLCSQDLRR